MSEYQVLIIEDDEILNAGLCYNLEKRGISPFSAFTLKEAVQYLEKQHFHLIILDVNLPDGNGFDFARRTISKFHTPFLFLTAHNLEEEVVSGFQLGADDYIIKPFSLKILMEKIQVVLRRSCTDDRPALYQCGNLNIDFKNRIVHKCGEILSLTPTEFELLKFFCKNQAQILTKEILLENIWDNRGNFVNEHTLSLNISRLRNKIADDEYGYIKTIYGMGYKWTGSEGGLK